MVGGGGGVGVVVWSVFASTHDTSLVWYVYTTIFELHADLSCSVCFLPSM